MPVGAGAGEEVILWLCLAFVLATALFEPLADTAESKLKVVEAEA